MKHLILFSLLLLLSCSDSTAPNDSDAPPVASTKLGAIYYGAYGFQISDQGFYDSHYDQRYETDLRFDGKRVWWDAKRGDLRCRFDGTLEGNTITGTQRYEIYTNGKPPEWDTSQPYTYTRR